MTDRTLRMFFVRGDVNDAVPAIQPFTDNTDATLVMAAPFFRTKVGTDTYVDDLW